MYHLRAPQKLPLVISADEAKRLPAVADSLQARVMLSLSYGCGLRAGEERAFVTAGGLLSYGPDRVDMYRRAAGYVQRTSLHEALAWLWLGSPHIGRIDRE
jgi:hypothetical protein